MFWLLRLFDDVAWQLWAKAVDPRLSTTEMDINTHGITLYFGENVEVVEPKKTNKKTK